VDMYFNPLDSSFTGPANLLSQPFVAAGQPNPFPSKPPPGNLDFGAAGFLPVGGGGVYYVNPHLRTPYIYQYNLSVQRELMHNLTLEVSYIGSDSHKLTALKDGNPFILGSNTRLFNTQPGTTSSSFSYLEEFNNAVQANYNSMAVGLQKRYSNTPIGDVQFQFSWTRSITRRDFDRRMARFQPINGIGFERTPISTCGTTLRLAAFGSCLSPRCGQAGRNG